MESLEQKQFRWKLLKEVREGDWVRWEQSVERNEYWGWVEKVLPPGEPNIRVVSWSYHNSSVYYGLDNNRNWIPHGWVLEIL